MQLKYLFSFLLMFCFFSAFSQDDLLDLINEDANKNSSVVFATFKGTKIINLQSIELTHKNELQFMISHRFGEIKGGTYDLYGLDYGEIRLSLDYGLLDWLNIGLARSSNGKIIDASVKYKIFHQGKGIVNNMISPFSIVGYSSIFLDPVDPSLDRKLSFHTSRLSYVHQLLIARKLSRNFSLQFSPTIFHYNAVKDSADSHDIIALGFGGRYKFTSSTSINFEWIPTYNNLSEYTNSVSLGVDIETGGHVFQLMLTNSLGMNEKAFIAENRGTWDNNNIHLGFNITRRFSFK